MSIGVVGHIEPDGTVILPRWIRKVSGVKPGDRLLVIYLLDDGKLMLMKAGPRQCASD